MKLLFYKLHAANSSSSNSNNGGNGKQYSKEEYLALKDELKRQTRRSSITQTTAAL